MHSLTLVHNASTAGTKPRSFRILAGSQYKDRQTELNHAPSSACGSSRGSVQDGPATIGQLCALLSCAGGAAAAGALPLASAASLVVPMRLVPLVLPLPRVGAGHRRGGRDAPAPPLPSSTEFDGHGCRGGREAPASTAPPTARSLAAEEDSPTFATAASPALFSSQRSSGKAAAHRSPSPLPAARGLGGLESCPLLEAAGDETAEGVDDDARVEVEDGCPRSPADKGFTGNRASWS
mmetsp:Transcript_18853/g.51873  ORF Transcript_18853/g.51873 Transcript_18853/m.51873 type:complete len:237 (+) Transcript_18853:663-1373(+)